MITRLSHISMVERVTNAADLVPTKIKTLLVTCLIAPLLSACPGETLVDPNTDFLLSTNFQGEDRVLTAVETGTDSLPQILLADVELNSNHQFWVISRKENGSFNISNVAVGDSFSIDVVNDGVADKIKFADRGDFSGQSWNITPMDNGYCMLTNNFTGPEIALDIRNEGENNIPFLAAAGDFSGQQWRIVHPDGPLSFTEEPLSQCTGEP